MNLDVSPYPRINGPDLLPYILLLVLVVIILVSLLIWFKMRPNGNQPRAGAVQSPGARPDLGTAQPGPAGAPDDHPGAGFGGQPQGGPQPPHPHRG